MLQNTDHLGKVCATTTVHINTESPLRSQRAEQHLYPAWAQSLPFALVCFAVSSPDRATALWQHPASERRFSDGKFMLSQVCYPPDLNRVVLVRKGML